MIEERRQLQWTGLISDISSSWGNPSYASVGCVIMNISTLLWRSLTIQIQTIVGWCLCSGCLAEGCLSSGKFNRLYPIFRGRHLRKLRRPRFSSKVSTSDVGAKKTLVRFDLDLESPVIFGVIMWIVYILHIINHYYTCVYIYMSIMFYFCTCLFDVVSAVQFKDYLVCA